MDKNRQLWLGRVVRSREKKIIAKDNKLISDVCYIKTYLPMDLTLHGLLKYK